MWNEEKTIWHQKPKSEHHESMWSRLQDRLSWGNSDKSAYEELYDTVIFFHIAAIITAIIAVAMSLAHDLGLL